jgi:hypothetical protein
MKFPFNQPEKTRDCGYRCLYYVLQPKESYERWLGNFRMFQPVKNGITCNDMHTVLDFHKKVHKFTQLTEDGLYVIYSGVWLKHGHYFVYHDGIVYCSTKSEPYRMPLAEVVGKLEAKTTEGAFRCLKIEK